jgi:hypothetical protein
MVDIAAVASTGPEAMPGFYHGLRKPNAKLGKRNGEAVQICNIHGKEVISE